MSDDGTTHDGTIHDGQGTYDVVLLVEQALSAADAKQVRSLHEEIADPVVCAASDQCHAVGICSPATGVCSDPALADGTPCDDASACTGTDTCIAGICAGSDPVICTASDQCHDAGTCDPGTGACSDPAKADGAACDDGDVSPRAQ